MKVLIVATEATPFVSIGGVGSVVGNLSKALKARDVDVRVFIPKFKIVDESKYKVSMVVEGLKVPTGDESSPYLICNIKSCVTDDLVTIYFLENQEYFEKRANVYGYVDDPTRFCLLSRGVIEFIRTGKFVPNVIHCNDWHTGSIPNLLRTTYKHDKVFEKIATVFTIHNLAYQGTFDHKHLSELEFDDGKSEVASMYSPQLQFQNFLKRGIMYSDQINTVSKTYAKEILTEEFGEGLDHLLLEFKGKLSGIINGIDYDEFDPSKDKHIEKNYTAGSLEKRAVNKTALQKDFDLPLISDVPLFGFVGRLDYMKGVDMLVNTMHQFLRDFDAQFVQVGGGNWTLVERLNELKKAFPTKVGIHTYPNFTLPRLIFSGSDAIVYPSRFEPCGIVQIEAMRYGSVPIVRKVGGLSDTVVDFDSVSKKGSGLMFKEFNEFSLYGQLVRACELYKNKSMWKILQKNGMRADFSWDFSSKEYKELYSRAIVSRSKRSEVAGPPGYVS